MTEIMKTALRDIAPGYTSFFIKAKDTERNASIHEAFKEFAKDECDNDYTLALDYLLKYHDEDAKFEALWEHHKLVQSEIDELKLEIATLTEAPKVEKKESKEAF